MPELNLGLNDWFPSERCNNKRKEKVLLAIFVALDKSL
jgi:hypothetical protein